MTAIAQQPKNSIDPLTQYQSILVAVDSSDHSNQAVEEAVRLAQYWGSKITGTHAYAAKMHDIRFRQMEGGLPEQYRVEQELEHQREVHNELITRGLSIITESYLDQIDRLCQQQELDFHRSSLEGKNYRALVSEANNGTYDLLVMGSIGVGAIEGSRIGTVCGRTVRRSNIDTLVIKQPQRKLSEGPIVVALDGSSKSYGALLTAFSLAKQWQVEIKVIATFDPYYHYVAFNRIAEVLSEEAEKVFKFKEQEKLHEDIIDSGLAKIYQGHLDVAQSIAQDYGVEIETRLLDGKAYDAIEKYVVEINPSLLVIGKMGVHADSELDIGGNAENLLRNVNCAILLSMQEHQPRIDRIAATTTSWSVEAEKRMLRVPDFVRPMARMAILRYAQEKGHTVITESIVEAATAELMPGNAENAMQEIVDAADRGELKKSVTSQAMIWSDAAEALLQSVNDPSLRENLKGRAEKKARADKTWQVEVQHIQPFTQTRESGDETTEAQELHWEAAAIARLMRAPEGFMRDTAKKNIEIYAIKTNTHSISLEVVEKGLEIARLEMEEQVRSGEKPAPKASKCPFAGRALADDVGEDTADVGEDTAMVWQPGTKKLLGNIPEGYCRDMAINAMETIARKTGLQSIDAEFVKNIMTVFRKGSAKVKESLNWQAAAKDKIAGAPNMIRGMLIQEIETWARQHKQQEITAQTVDQVKDKWRQNGQFHLDPDDPRNIS
ncbi:MAG: universal stress protein [Gammaproteobacteria bacterium]